MGLDVVMDGLDVVLEVVGLFEGPLAHRALERTDTWNNEDKLIVKKNVAKKLAP
jgi:hypothetical protein